MVYGLMKAFYPKEKVMLHLKRNSRKKREAVHLFSNIGSVQINNCFACNVTCKILACKLEEMDFASKKISMREEKRRRRMKLVRFDANV